MENQVKLTSKLKQNQAAICYSISIAFRTLSFYQRYLRLKIGRELLFASIYHRYLRVPFKFQIKKINHQATQTELHNQQSGMLAPPHLLRVATPHKCTSRQTCCNARYHPKYYCERQDGVGEPESIPLQYIPSIIEQLCHAWRRGAEFCIQC
jgi:hypothetical protein